MNMLSPLSFNDFFRVPESGTHETDTSTGLTFSILPPTPQDVLMTRPFTSPMIRTGQANGFFPNSLASPVGADSGIMAPTFCNNNVPIIKTPTKGGSRAPSASITTTPPRHSPYQLAAHSRKSSVSSMSSVGDPANNAHGADIPPPAIDPGTLCGINPSALRPSSRVVSISDVSEGSVGSWQTPHAFDGDDLSDEDEVVAEEEDKPVVKQQIRRPAFSRTPSTASKQEEEPESEASPKKDTKPKKRVTKVLVDHPPTVKLVTAITASGKKSHARKRPEDHIPRPRNAFILFRKHVVDAKLIPPEVEIRHQNISVVVSKMWAEADPETKVKFQTEARIEKEAHMKAYPDYKYQPVYRRAQVVRRKVKADPVEDKKCDVIANLLMEGAEGEDLQEGAAKAVDASNKKRARLARALAAKNARKVSQSRSAGSGGCKGRSSSPVEPPSDAISEVSETDQPEEDGQALEKSSGSSPLQEQAQFDPAHFDPNVTPVVPPQMFGTPEMTRHYGTFSMPHMHTASAVSANMLPVAGPSSYASNPQCSNFQPTFTQQDYSIPMNTYQYNPAQQQSYNPNFANSNYQSGFDYDFAGQIDPFGQAPPSEYVMAMYDHNIAPMGFAAGPPGAIPDLSDFGTSNPMSFPLDLDLTNYDEALAQMGDFQTQPNVMWT